MPFFCIFSNSQSRDQEVITEDSSEMRFLDTELFSNVIRCLIAQCKCDGDVWFDSLVRLKACDSSQFIMNEGGRCVRWLCERLRLGKRYISMSAGWNIVVIVGFV